LDISVSGHYIPVGIVVVCQMMYNGVKWKGDLKVLQEPNEYDTVFLESTNSEQTMEMV